MGSQESMFADQEQSYKPRNGMSEPRPANADPREQPREQPVRELPSYEQGYGSEPVEGSYGEPVGVQYGGEKLQPQRPRNRGRGRILAVIILIAALVFGAGMFMSSNQGISGLPGQFNSGFNRHSTQQQTQFVSGVPTLIINNARGDVHIHTGGAGQVTIKATRDGFGFNGNNNNLVNIQQTGDAVNVTPLGDNVGSVDLDITMPSAGNVQVTDTTGDITVDDMSGNLTINTVSGNIKAEHVSGAMSLSTISGDVELSGTLSGDSVVTTLSGDITYNGPVNPGGNYRFNTGSGDVHLNLSPSSAFKYDLGTSNGTIRNDFNPGGGNTGVVGTAPSASLTVRTGNGDITLNQGD